MSVRKEPSKHRKSSTRLTIPCGGCTRSCVRFHRFPGPMRCAYVCAVSAHTKQWPASLVLNFLSQSIALLQIAFVSQSVGGDPEWSCQSWGVLLAGLTKRPRQIYLCRNKHQAAARAAFSSARNVNWFFAPAAIYNLIVIIAAGARPFSV